MSNPYHVYVHSQLAAAGFCILSSTWAWRLRPDLWSTAQACAGDYRRTTVEGAHRRRATLADGSDVGVLARSLDALNLRISWVTGLEVTALAPEAEPATASEQADASAFAQQARARQAAEKLAKLKALATEDLPAHDCFQRRAILKARVDLAGLAASPKHGSLAP